MTPKLGPGHLPQGEFYKALAMDELIKEVKRFITEETKLGQTGLAKLCNYSTGVISAFLGRTYKGDADRVRNRMIGAIELYRERVSRQQPLEFVTTDQSRAVEQAIMYALRNKQSAAVLADSGLGKTMAARHVANREFGVVYVACDCNDFRQRAFLDRIAGDLGMGGDRKRATWELQRQIQERLVDTEWALVIDDAHYLIHPQSPSRSIALDVMKDLQAAAGTPFVLLGVPELWHTIAARMHGDWYAQLKRRLVMVQILRTAQVQSDDVECVTRSLGAKCSAGVLHTLTALARRPGGYGNVEKAVRWTTRENNDRITRDSLELYMAKSGTPMIHIGKDEEDGKADLPASRQPAEAVA